MTSDVECLIAASLGGSKKPVKKRKWKNVKQNDRFVHYNISYF